MTENRQFYRVKFAAQTSIEQAGQTHHAVLIDISMKGALIKVTSPVEGLMPFNRCSISVHLDSSDVVLHFDAEVVHVRDDLVGMKFVGVDIETMIHLRSLLELNTADPDQVRSELAIFLGNR